MVESDAGWIDKALADIVVTDEILNAEKYIEDQGSKNRYPAALAQLQARYDEILSKPSHSRPHSVEHYKQKFEAEKFIFMVFSSSPGKSWDTFDMYKVATHFYKPALEDVWTGIWNLVDMGLIGFTPDRSLKVSDTIKPE